MRVVDDNVDGVIDREEFFTLVKMSTLRAEHKREKRERRKESVVKIKQSFIAGAVRTVSCSVVPIDTSDEDDEILSWR